MEPLITNRIDPALLRVPEKRGDEREPVPRRKRPSVPGNPVEHQTEEEEELEQQPDSDTPKHAVDDLA
jgi:hypothetical protein